MRNRQKKEGKKQPYLKLSSNYWTSTQTPILRFYD